MNYLFIDYGATNIKSCLYDTLTDQFYDFRVDKCPNNLLSYPKYEIGINSLSSITRKIMTSRQFECVFMSTQMHGFSVYDGMSVSNYVSWKDERADIHDQIDCRQLSGITPRKGLPVYNIPAYLKEANYSEARILDLPSAIIKNIGKYFGACHSTIACGFGAYSLQTGKVTNSVSKLMGESVIFPEFITDIRVIGYLLSEGKEYPVFSPVGDLQSAVLGTGIKTGQVCINLGTGSQVSMVSNSLNKNTDNRSYFDNKYLNTITHIPSGRAIESFLSFMNSIGYRRDFWKLINDSTTEEILSSTLDIKLGTFGGFSGSISNLRENNMVCNNLELSIIRCYVEQYKAHLDKFDANSILLSGGVVKNCPIIADLFRQMYDLPVEVNNTSVEETFLGLREISRMNK